MAKRSNRYKMMERFCAVVLYTDAISFFLYLIFAGIGVIWLKVICAIGCFALSGFLLWLMFASRELFRRRSLWITTGALAVIICLLFSLFLNYPSPL